MNKSLKKQNIYQVKISLKNIKPLIWRRVLIPANITFLDFHEIIQASMGWENDHLYSFQVGDFRNGISIQATRDPLGGKLDDFFASHDYAAENTKLQKFFSQEKDKLDYEYDFGDSWHHAITLEKILNYENVSHPVPLCIGGAQMCPPEDCGGPWGYLSLKEILANHNHPDHEDMLEWMGGKLPDWNLFSLEEANKRLGVSQQLPKAANG